ncbi:MAG: sigma-70 family RNA polymerase sigma factor [candidate division Zixibacteria bacterium]|nr:sigma-70 family RNA polymerase sigma factor [candidate division Zixibacteria bacterium]
MSQSIHEFADISDDTLIAGCLSGDQKAMDRLYRVYFTSEGTVYRWVYLKATWVPEDEKQDLLNDIFVAVVQSLAQFERRSALRTYIDRIAKMKCLDAMPSLLGLARGKGIRFVDIDEHRSDGDPVVQVEDSAPENRPDRAFEEWDEKDVVFILHTALTRCTGPRCRQALALYMRELQEEISREDIAAELDLPVERASQMIYDCLYRLRKQMQKKFRDYRHFADCVCDGVRTGAPRSLRKESL